MKILWDGQLVAEFQGETLISSTPAFKKIYKEFQEKGLPVMGPPKEKPKEKGLLVDAVEIRKELGILLNALQNNGYEIELEEGE